MQILSQITNKRGGILVLGSLQEHFVAMVDVCPTIGTTDFGRPAAVLVEEVNEDE